MDEIPYFSPTKCRVWDTEGHSISQPRNEQIKKNQVWNAREKLGNSV